LAVYCHRNLAIRPQAGRAVLFYSQFPNGVQDTSAWHGACPVFNGTKWVSNLDNLKTVQDDVISLTCLSPISGFPGSESLGEFPQANDTLHFREISLSRSTNEFCLSQILRC